MTEGLALSPGGVFVPSDATADRSDRRATIRPALMFRFNPDWLSLLKISQDGETGGGGGNMLERMPDQNRAEGINCPVVELEQLRKSIQDVPLYLDGNRRKSTGTAT
jgi:hypothetical protein